MKFVLILVLIILQLRIFAIFLEVSNVQFPKAETLYPEPPVPYPDGTISYTFENHGNYWAIAPADKNGQFVLKVLPAQANDKWVVDKFSGLKPGKWKWVQADVHGFVWLSDGNDLYKLNVKNPSQGVIQVSSDSQFPVGKITAMGISPNGLILIALNHGELVEVKQKFEPKAKRIKNTLDLEKAPKNISQIYADIYGNVWLRGKNKVFKKDASEKAWQKNWEEVSLMPGGSHDLSGDVYNGKFYMSWAISGDYGYPSTGSFHRKLLEFDPRKNRWNVFADYGYPRGYGGTSFLGEKIWTVGGDAKDESGKRYTTKSAQLINPYTKEVRNGPNLPTEIPSAISFNVDERLYTLGYNARKKGEVNPLYLKIYSIGAGESEWTEESNGPEGGGSSYGTQLDGVIYTVVDHKYLAAYNTKNKVWKTIDIPNKPRSPAVGHYRGDIWIMGGRNKESEDTCYIYNPTTTEWRKGPKLPRPLIWGCAFNIDGDLYLTGGFSYHSSFNHRTFKLRRES